ncbi:hypothetical protein AB0L53_31925 [Nonomuraea sp. NPDC052129]|uniref:DUF6197 family protein n=1 Tax=Nonomuraea sp. NPDC052129 TaxID=3154651 RepID=UPI0034167647
MTTLDTAEIRRKTAELLRQRGWVKDEHLADSAHPTECRLCLVEAIGQAAGLPPLSLSTANKRAALLEPAYRGQYRAVRHTIAELAVALGWLETSTQGPMYWLLNWNDAADRSVDDVLSVLEGQAV